MDLNEDRNFDPITEHFAKKVYGGLKGEIRLAVLRRDLKQVVDDLSQKLDRPLRILDIGAGLAQISLSLATQGHDVTINDISINMLAQAKMTADRLSIKDKIHWISGPYQTLDSTLVSSDTKDSKYDLILCHALLEWLGHPKDIMSFFSQWLAQHGVLSLCFYNPASFVYRNLIMGNFNLLNNPEFQSDNIKSLTPNNPVSYEDAREWLIDEGFEINQVTGLRVFHDYATLKRGGHTNPEAVIEMELKYSTQAPYKWLGRYLHILAASNPS